MPGIDLIAAERQEQLTKHHRSVELDMLINKEGQLISAAQELCFQTTLDPRMSLPQGWDLQIWTKMISKPHIQRLIIAGALIAAEIDRLDHERNIQVNRK